MKLIKASIDIDSLIRRQTRKNIDWKDIFNNNDFTQEDINKLCDNIIYDDFWSALAKSSKYVNNIDVKYVVKNQQKLINFWLYYITNHTFNKEELIYLFNNITNRDFWYYIHYISDECITDNNMLYEICEQVNNSMFWDKIFTTDKGLQIDVKMLVQYQEKIDWGTVYNAREFTEQEVKYLCNNIQNGTFWWWISREKYINYVDVKNLTKHQYEVYWSDLPKRNILTKDELNYLFNNLDNNSMLLSKAWNYILYEHIDVIDVASMKQKQDEINWEQIFDNRQFTNEELKYLYENVKNSKAMTIIRAQYTVVNMTYQELINNKNEIMWRYVDLDSLNISENEKKLLLTRIPILGVKYTEDISDDFSQIKEKPIKRFYTIGDRDMHGNRTGAFVVVKDGNHSVEVLFEPNGSHDEMLIKMAKKYGYDDATLMKLMNVEARNEDISGKMDLDSEKEKELEYAKENLHCCCGYVHVDKNNKNPIAIMDATRVYNFSPQAVARILANKQYEGQDIIAFGINDAGASSIAFMKVAKLSKKRLISHNFRILYWYNNGC